MPQYYALYAWKNLADLGTQVKTQVADCPDVYVTSAVGKNGRCGVLVSFFTNDRNVVADRKVEIEVKGLDIRRRNDGRFTAKWECADPVYLFLDKNINSRPRDIAPMSRFYDGMELITPLRIYENGMVFELDTFGDVAIVPVSVRDCYGRESPRVIMTVLGTFDNVMFHVKRDHCIITMDWPDKANWAEVVMTRGEEVQSHILSRSEYTTYRSVMIPLEEGYDYRCSIHAIYDTKGAKQRSDPVEMDISTKKRERLSYVVYSERHGTVVDFKIPPSMTSIPRIIAVKTAEGIPLSSNDGYIYWDSGMEIPIRNGKASIYAKGKKFDESTRLFFKDDSEYKRYYVMHPLNGRETR
jgi:hypothetical protein